jgi:hypothetical protein
MNSRRFLTVTVSAVTLLTGLHTVRAEAQGVILQQQQDGRRGNFQDNRFNRRQEQQQRALQNSRAAAANALTGPAAARMRRLQASDPSRTAVNYLLTRNDVRSELVITTRQREALEELNKKAPAEMIERFRNSETLQKMQERSRQLRELPPGERQAQQQKIREEMRASGEQLMTEFQNHQGELDKRAEEILTPAQLKRLHQLDLQFRGGLALSETKRGQELALTPEQSQTVAQLLEEYRTKQRELTSEAMGYGERVIRPNGPLAPNENQANPANPPEPGNRATGRARGRTSEGGPQNQGATAQATRTFQVPNPQQTQVKLAEAQFEIDQLRKTLGAKVLATLNAEQAAYWKDLLGRPFTFRSFD